VVTTADVRRAMVEQPTTMVAAYREMHPDPAVVFDTSWVREFEEVTSMGAPLRALCVRL